MKGADLITYDVNDNLLDLETVPAAKLATKSIIATPPYEGQDLNINWRDGLDVLDRLDELQGALA
jgi:hypothetical protein